MAWQPIDKYGPIFEALDFQMAQQAANASSVAVRVHHLYQNQPTGRDDFVLHIPRALIRKMEEAACGYADAGGAVARRVDDVQAVLAKLKGELEPEERVAALETYLRLHEPGAGALEKRNQAAEDFYRAEEVVFQLLREALPKLR